MVKLNQAKIIMAKIIEYILITALKKFNILFMAKMNMVKLTQAKLSMAKLN